MISTWFGFINTFRMFFIFCFMSFHIINVVSVFLIQETSVLLSELSLFLKLKDWSTIWGIQIECRNIIFSNENFISKRCFHLLLLLRSIRLKVVTLMCISLVTRRSTTTAHMSRQRSRFKTWNTINSHSSFNNETLSLILVHAHKQVRTYPSSTWILQRTSVSVDLKTSI